MKLKQLFGEVDRLVDQKLSKEEKDNSEGNIKLGDFLSMLNKMGELMELAEKNGFNEYSNEKGELKAMKELINNEFNDLKK
jgi:hypothetical protein